ncbi:PREDICTED: ribonuclease 3-like protein 1 [Tarenaya hassleriana]|uniref:ribonuclease 3-like protein 1 n=1 Tax=Tarenaya hassleriana TaxID=28532 RepID=UPI00053C334F|nr:PREDICTED: ribonuclease 3-like protein 1 [Tarenaya hassleriana]
MEETKNVSENPSKSFVSLEDMSPLDPSSVPSSPSVKPETRMLPVYEAEQSWDAKSKMNVRKRNEAKENDDNSSLSTKEIDPNSAISRDITQERKRVPEPVEDLICNTRPRIEACSDEPKREWAKSQLHELCVKRHWKAPVYECCNDKGPCHMRLYTCKVVIEVKESSSTTVLECFGSPCSKKKLAAEHAAEGALWYLKQMGHSFRTHKAFG